MCVFFPQLKKSRTLNCRGKAKLVKHKILLRRQLKIFFYNTTNSRKLPHCNIRKDLLINKLSDVSFPFIVTFSFLGVTETRNHMQIDKLLIITSQFRSTKFQGNVNYLCKTKSPKIIVQYCIFFLIHN